jgi:glucose-1-phosphate adenylyltransferase
VIRRELLIRLVEEAHSRSQKSFERDILLRQLGELQIGGYEMTEYAASVYSLASYFEANMALLDPAVRAQVFLPERRIFTKMRDCGPAVYGLHANVTDSLVADGAVIEGEVTRSILFRDVKVGPGVHLDNCIVMQGAEIRADAKLGYVICDKDVLVCDAASLQGVSQYPVYVKKGMKI